MSEKKEKRARTKYFETTLKVVIPNTGGKLVEIDLRFPAELADVVRWDQNQNGVAIYTGAAGNGARVAASTPILPTLAAPTESRQPAEDDAPPPGFHSSSTLSVDELEKKIEEQNFSNAVNNVGVAPKSPRPRHLAAKALRTIDVEVPGEGRVVHEVSA